MESAEPTVPEEGVTTEGLTLNSRELLPRTPEFEAVLNKVKVPR